MPPWTITTGHLSRAARAIHLALAALAALAASLALFSAACGAAFDGTTYRANGVAFQVPPPPESWQPIDVSHAALAFRDVESDATIAVNGRCGRDSPDVPLSSLTQHLFIQFTEREVLAQEVVPFDAREAMHTTLLAKLDGVPKKFDVWVLKKDGCVYDILFIASPSRFAAGIEQFQRFARGFKALSSDAS